MTYLNGVSLIAPNKCRFRCGQLCGPRFASLLLYCTYLSTFCTGTYNLLQPNIDGFSYSWPIKGNIAFKHWFMFTLLLVLYNKLTCCDCFTVFDVLFAKAKYRFPPYSRDLVFLIFVFSSYEAFINMRKCLVK